MYSERWLKSITFAIYVMKINGMTLKRDLHKYTQEKKMYTKPYYRTSLRDNLIRKIRYCRQVMLVIHTLMSNLSGGGTHIYTRRYDTHKRNEILPAMKKNNLCASLLKCFMCPHNAPIDSPFVFFSWMNISWHFEQSTRELSYGMCIFFDIIMSPYRIWRLNSHHYYQTQLGLSSHWSSFIERVSAKGEKTS